MQTEQKAPQADTTPPATATTAAAGRNHLGVEIAAGLSSVAMGMVTAWRLVMERSHNNLSTLGIIRDLKGPRDRWGESHVAALKNGMDRSESARLIKEASTKYQGLLAERFNKAGYSSFGERLNILHPFQKWEVAVTSLAVTGVALGSILILTKDLFADKVQQNKNDESRER